MRDASSTRRPWSLALPYMVTAALSGCGLRVIVPLQNSTDTSAAHLVFTRQPSGGPAGSPIGGGVVIELRNSENRLVTDGADATAFVTLGISTGNGQFTGTKTVQAVGGVADFSGADLRFELGGTKTLLATKSDTGSGVASVESNPFTITVPPVTGFHLLAGALNPNAYADGIAAGARVNGPMQMVYDGSTYVYFGDSSGTIRRITVATGEITTIAGSAYQRGNWDGTGSSARFDHPRGIALAGGHLYVSDDVALTIRDVDLGTGSVTTLAGDPYQNGHVNGTGSAVQFSSPGELAVIGSTLYIADARYVRAMALSAPYAVSDFAGNGYCGHTGGPVTGAAVCSVEGLATDGTDLYVGDLDNRLKKIDVALGQVSVLVDHSGQGGAGAPSTLAVAGGIIYYEAVANRISKYTIADATDVRLAGTTWKNGFSDGDAATARFQYPIEGMAVVGSTLYVSDTINGAIREVDVSTGNTSTLYNVPTQYSASVWGHRGSANFHSLAADLQAIYTAGAEESLIDSTSISTGTFSSFVGSASNWGYLEGTGSSAKIYGTQDMYSDGSDVYFVDRANSVLRKVEASTRQTSLVAGRPGDSGSADGALGVGQLGNSVRGLAYLNGKFYVTDNSTIRSIDPVTGVIATLAGNGTPGCADGNGTGSAIVNEGGSMVALGARIYFIDNLCGAIREFDPADNSVTSIAGQPGGQGPVNGLIADGPLGTATFGTPWSLSGYQTNVYGSITTDGVYLYVADTYNSVIRRIDTATGVTTTLWGAPRYNETIPGAAGSVRFAEPQGIVFSYGKFYVVDDYGILVSD